MQANPGWLDFFRSLLPENLAASPIVFLAVLGIAGLVILFTLVSVIMYLFGGRRSKGGSGPNLEERLGTYPPARPFTGDRRLLVEGVPVRLRLVVIGPAGTASDFDNEKIEDLLGRLVPGLDEIFRNDKPRVRIWPTQLSYEGFTTHFHRNTIVPEKEGELSQWVVVAGRAKLGGKTQVMIGLAVQALKPTTVGRRTIDAHEWESTFRIRVRD